MAAELVLANDTGKLTAVVEGRYAAIDLSKIGSNRGKLDLDRFYDAPAYRPRFTGLLGLPMFLH
jgi:hypothetical protein